MKLHEPNLSHKSNSRIIEVDNSESSAKNLDLTAQHLSPLSNQQFKHDKLYNFWHRSEGIWFSKLAKVAIRLLNEQELEAISQIHHLEQAEFGIRLSWEYYTKDESGYTSWCVDADRPGLIFTDRGVASFCQPSIYNYRMVDDNTLVTSVDKFEETTCLEGDSHRLRERRYEGRLITHFWENKFTP